MIIIDTGDTVFHKPTHETWLVAYVRDNHLSWCGWPCGEANLSDCLLVDKATPGECAELLKDMTAMNSSDPRCCYAMRRLSAPRTPEDKGDD